MTRHVRHHNFLILPLFLLIAVCLSASLQAAQPDEIAISVDRRSVTPKVEIPLTPEEEVWLSEHKILRVAGPKAFPPFHYYEKDGTVKGMASDYIRFLVERLGIQMEIQRNLPWPEVLRKARQKEIDVISCAARSAEREAYLSFSNPYLTFPLVIISRRDGPFISGLDDLHGKKVSLIKKVMTYEWLKRDKIAVIPIFVNTPLEGLKAVSLGVADAYIGNLAAISYMIEKNGLANLKIAAPTTYGNYNLYFAVRKDWPQLVSIINKALGAMTPEQHAAIRNRWLSVRYEYGIRKADLLKWVLGISGIAALILIVILFWNRTLSREIHERKQAEEALQKISNEQTILLGTVPAMIFWIDKKGKFIRVNESFAAALNKSPDEIRGKSIFDLYPEDMARKFHDDNMEVMKSKTQKRNIEEPVETLAGTMWVKTDKIPYRDEKGDIVGIIGFSVDITERKRMEEQLRQSQKMEAIGTLAGGIAHDFNNLLTVIIGNAQLALMKVIKDESLRKGIEEIEKAGDRAASLVRQLLAFSRKQIIKPDVLDLNEEINETEKMLKRVIGEDIEFQTVLGPELWKVYADPGHINQVIMNMVVNAKDAMLQGGKLIIETANADLDENYFRERGIKEAQPGPYVMLAVSDTGSGMDKETQEHIFEPFFTTKEVGKGSGLGLYTIYGIVKQNNGFIWVYSEPGKGTTFKVYLPKMKVDAEPEEKEQTSVDDLGGSETVLIVEDDDGLRKLAQEVLQGHGYKILAAENGEEALKVGKEHEGPIHLLLTDVVMPKMGGKEAADRLQPLYPQMKVIYMSGYTDNAIIHHGVLTSEMNFLEKPFTPEGLARKVREVLKSEN